MLGLVGAVGAAVLPAAVLRTCVVGNYVVASGSMEPTLLRGDRVLGEKLTRHAGRVRAGDVVTFLDPEGTGRVLVKRVIATGGQMVDLRDGVAWIDGAPLAEPYAAGQTRPLARASAVLDEPLAYPYTVPAGCIFVLGDNRGGSRDSRAFGAVPLRLVRSRALCVYWPAGRARTL